MAIKWIPVGSYIGVSSKRDMGQVLLVSLLKNNKDHVEKRPPTISL